MVFAIFGEFLGVQLTGVASFLVRHVMVAEFEELTELIKTDQLTEEDAVEKYIGSLLSLQ